MLSLYRNFLSLLVLSGLLFCSSALAQSELSRVNVGELTYTLLGEGLDYSLLISPTSKITPLSKNLTANAFFAKKPSRLVIDLPGFSKGKNRLVEVSDKNIEGFRVGVHSDKTRLVFDIKNNMIPTYNVVANPTLGAIVISYSLSSGTVSATSGSEATSISKMPAKPATSLGGTPFSVKKDLSDEIKRMESKMALEAAKIKEKSVLPKQTTQKQPELSGETIVFRGNVPKAEAEKKPEATQRIEQRLEDKLEEKSVANSIITQILFQAPSDAPLGALAISGSNLEGYSLNQKGPNLYELVLNNAQLEGDHLTLPQFPPETFKGFEVVLANQKGQQVVIKVYVNDEVKLSPYLAKGKLWLKAN